MALYVRHVYDRVLEERGGGSLSFQWMASFLPASMYQIGEQKRRESGSCLITQLAAGDGDGLKEKKKKMVCGKD